MVAQPARVRLPVDAQRVLLMERWISAHSVSTRIDLGKRSPVIFTPLQDPRDLEQNLPALLEQWYRYIWRYMHTSDQARLTIPLEGKRSKKGNVTYRDKKYMYPGTQVRPYSCTAVQLQQLYSYSYSCTAVLRYLGTEVQVLMMLATG